VFCVHLYIFGQKGAESLRYMGCEGASDLSGCVGRGGGGGGPRTQAACGL
jgi:hypothetical protein